MANRTLWVGLFSVIYAIPRPFRVVRELVYLHSDGRKALLYMVHARKKE